MSGWLHELPVRWIAVVVVAAITLLVAAIYQGMAQRAPATEAMKPVAVSGAAGR